MGSGPRPYTAGFFQMTLDGDPTTAYLKSVKGGWESQEFVQEGFGEAIRKLTHGTTAAIDEIEFEFGMAGASSVLKWIRASWDKNYQRRNGQIDHADFDTNITFSHEFSDALITETTFPKLDGASKEGGYVKVKFLPESVDTHAGSGKLQAHYGSKQKMWNCSCFRFSIDGVDGFQYSNSIESFTVKQGVKKMAVGNKRFPELFPTKLEFPQMVGTVAEAYGKAMKDWHTEYVRKGKRDPKALKTGSLEYLAPDKSTVLWRINLYHVGLKKLEMADSTANSDQIKRLKYTLSVEQMEMDGQFGFDD